MRSRGGHAQKVEEGECAKEGGGKVNKGWFGLSWAEVGLYLTFFAASFSLSLTFMSTKAKQRLITYPTHLGYMGDPSYPVVDPDDCGNDEERVMRVFEWAKARGAYIHPHVSTGLFPIPGNMSSTLVRGLRASGPVLKDQVIFAIPPATLINIMTVVNDTFWREKFQTIPGMSDGVAGVAVWMLRESMNKSSEWRPYLCSLPRTVPLPLFYNTNKLAMVRGSVPNDQLEVFDTLMEQRRDSFEVKYMQLVPRLMKQFSHDFPMRAYTYERFVWAASIILSRSWGRMIDEGDMPYHDTALKISKHLNSTSTTSATKGKDDISTRGAVNKTYLKNVHTLAPAADMPNHDAQGHQAAKAPDGSLVLRAGTAVAPGEQIFISYGGKCDAQFLTTYGFTPYNNSHIPCSNETAPPRGSELEKQLKWRQNWRDHFVSYYAAIKREAVSSQSELVAAPGGEALSETPSLEH